MLCLQQLHQRHKSCTATIHLRNDLDYVGWGVKLYSLTHCTATNLY